MGETKSQTVLGRIAAAGREDHQARAMTLQKAMRVSLVKAADSLMDLPLAVIGSVVQQVQGDALESIINEEALLLLLDGPTAVGGGVLVDPVLVGGLIQQQTIGTVRADTGAVRQMTRTDAAICAPLLDAMFERVPNIVDSAEDARLIEGFRFGAKAEHGRSLLMTLEASDYTVLRLTLDLARGTRQGEIVLILPIIDQIHIAPGAEDDSVDKVPQAPQMSKVVMDLTAELDMVLCRLNLPLKQLQSMKPGDVLAVPTGQFPDVQICTTAGRVVGKGTVGHVDGMRAVKPKRKPLHATQPLRRASDEDRVDMPKVEEIGGERRQPKDQKVLANDARGEDVDAAAPPENRDRDEARSDKAEDKIFAIGNEPEVDLPTLENFPELDDLPDLEDLPDLAELQEVKLPIAS